MEKKLSLLFLFVAGMAFAKSPFEKAVDFYKSGIPAMAQAVSASAQKLAGRRVLSDSPSQVSESYLCLQSIEDPVFGAMVSIQLFNPELKQVSCVDNAYPKYFLAQGEGGELSWAGVPLSGAPGQETLAMRTIRSANREFLVLYSTYKNHQGPLYEGVYYFDRSSNPAPSTSISNY